MSGQVSDFEPELLVDGCLHGGRGIVDDVTKVAEAGDEGADVVFGELADGWVVVLAGVAGERGGALVLDLAGPLGDGFGVGAGVEGGLVTGKPGIAVGDEGLGVVGVRGEMGGAWAWVLGFVHLADGLLEAVRGEDDQQPVVDGGQQVGFPEVDVAGVADVAGQGVFPGVAAPVVGGLVAVLALHPASAVPAVQPAAQHVGAGDPLVRLAAAAPGTPGTGHDGLRGLVVSRRNQRLVGDGIGPHPAAGLVPAHPGLVARGEAGEVLGEDPPDHPGGVRVGLEFVQALAVGGLGRIGVRPGVDEQVAVRWPAAEEPALERGLGGHGRADPQPDPVPLAFGQAAEHRHDQVVGLGVRVDRPADLGHPQLDPVVGEHGHHQAVLVAVERPLRLPDHHRVKAAAGISQVREQLRRLRAAFPRQRPGLADIEVLRDDDPAGRLDQGATAGLLPVAGRLRVLVVLGGDPAVEREPLHRPGCVQARGRRSGAHRGAPQPGFPVAALC